ncbi:hypothetical protein CUZ56_00250 [Saezia sanguinis]|uniref:Uncharacterized protein n=1 Tax=Saezia sanguinis TaxID=1965230 RepID=A0A433SGA2_9BURK|nr:hypothetical protein [Saezia sanguinis]RUS67773.1 hypothetical protein CUZ56_00250 [Saezia sanguinis]
MDSIEMNVDVYIDVGEFFNKLDDEPLIEEIRNRGYQVIADSPKPDDPEYIQTAAECILPIVDLFKTEENRPEGIKLVKAILTRVMAFL